MSVLKIENLSYVYNQGMPNETMALHDINLEIEEGTFVGIIGHTGSGKSTFISHLNGLTKPQTGRIFLDGKDIWTEFEDIRQVRFNVGLVFQYPEYQLFEETCYKDIAFGPKNMGLDDEEIDIRVRMAAEFCGIDEKMLEGSPFDLSGGQKRRVAIASVLAVKPEILIMDEPTAGLDPKGREELMEMILSLKESEGLSIVMVSHSMEDVAKLADRIVVMDKGHIVYDDEPRKVFAHYKELEEMGLAAPQMMYVMQDLKDAGFDVRTDVTTIEEAKEEILRIVT